MASTRKPTACSTTHLVVTVAVLLALAAAAQGRQSVAGTIQPMPPTVVAAQPPAKPMITFFQERGCGGLVDQVVGCGACVPMRDTQGYLVTFTEPGQTAVFFSGERCGGRRMVELRPNSCYCFPPTYGSVSLRCPPVADNATAVDGQGYGN